MWVGQNTPEYVPTNPIKEQFSKINLKMFVNGKELAILKNSKDLSYKLNISHLIIN